ncbi:hypothetical protein CVT26_000332 [Gymnopilus dilepis]|uniref:Uncharacterized protein n=1 Tax=Gymnopilus dilepis TaxID=231916 RepID=A0A409VHK5_9AGAR|nr:hypothetical protein CVT26_000332 [Gymnopilus dilepis]
MRVSFHFLYLAIALFAAKANADIIAFSGNECDGAEGENVPCLDECIDFNTRHSFRVLASGSHCVVAFQDAGCTIPVGSISNSGGGQCSNVNTGTTVLGLKCSPNSVCDTIASGNSTIKGVALPGPSSAVP